MLITLTNGLWVGVTYVKSEQNLQTHMLGLEMSTLLLHSAVRTICPIYELISSDPGTAQVGNTEPSWAQPTARQQESKLSTTEI